MPFIIFNMFIDWIRVKTQLNEEKNITQSWVSRTTTIQRKGPKPEYIWNPAIAIALVSKLVIVLMIEFVVIYVFVRLQCSKFNIHNNNCLGRILGNYRKYLTIPEGYRCYTGDFTHQTFFGFNRTKTHLCHGTASKTTCWIPDAIQKTFLNGSLVILTLMATIFIAIELITTIFKQTIRAIRVQATQDTISESGNKDFNFDGKGILNGNSMEPPLYHIPPTEKVSKPAA